MRPKTPFGSGRRPFDGTAGKTGGGPSFKLNNESNVFAAVRFCADRTGRFCVTVWPNTDPKTPRS